MPSDCTAAGVTKGHLHASPSSAQSKGLRMDRGSERWDGVTSKASRLAEARAANQVESGRGLARRLAAAKNISDGGRRERPGCRALYGWGSRIRTSAYGSRVRCPTARRTPSGQRILSHCLAGDDHGQEWNERRKSPRPRQLGRGGPTPRRRGPPEGLRRAECGPALRPGRQSPCFPAAEG